MIRYVACITSYSSDNNSDIPIRMSIVISDMYGKYDPLVYSRDWWIDNYSLDDMLNEVDDVLGDLDAKYPELTKIHVNGLAPLKQLNGNYLSNYVTRENLQQLMEESPELFE